MVPNQVVFLLDCGWERDCACALLSGCSGKPLEFYLAWRQVKKSYFLGATQVYLYPQRADGSWDYGVQLLKRGVCNNRDEDITRSFYQDGISAQGFFAECRSSLCVRQPSTLRGEARWTPASLHNPDTYYPVWVTGGATTIEAIYDAMADCLRKGVHNPQLHALVEECSECCACLSLWTPSAVPD